MQPENKTKKSNMSQLGSKCVCKTDKGKQCSLNSNYGWYCGVHKKTCKVPIVSNSTALAYQLATIYAEKYDTLHSSDDENTLLYLAKAIICLLDDPQWVKNRVLVDIVQGFGDSGWDDGGGWRGLTCLI